MPSMEIKQSKIHEKKLLKKVNFLDWKREAGHRETQVLQRYHVIGHDDYKKYSGFCRMVQKLVHILKQLNPNDPYRIEMTDMLLENSVRNYVQESVEKIEKVEKGRSVTYRVIGGELQKMHDPYMVMVTFSFPRAQEKEEDDEMCIAKWQVEYETLVPTTPLPEKSKRCCSSISHVV